MKSMFVFGVVLATVACGTRTITVSKKTPVTDVNTDNAAQFDESEFSLCSAINPTTLQCTDQNGNLVTLQSPTMPSLNGCNKCITRVSGLTASTICPNGISFVFNLIQGPKGDKGDTGSQGVAGAKGDKGDTGSTGAKGDTGSQGAKGDQGIQGIAGTKGDSCSVSTNFMGQAVITCGQTSQVLTGCGGNGCWSFGAKGNVYRIPTTTTTMPDFSTMTPVAVATTDNFSVFSAPYTPGFPWTFTNGFADKEYFAVDFSGFIDVPAAPNNTTVWRLTSDDGARLLLGSSLTEVVSMPGLQSPTSKTGMFYGLPGRYFFRLQYFQGPRTQIALALEVSVDGGTTFSVVPTESLTYQIQ